MAKKLSLKLERQTSILEFFGPTRGEAEAKTAGAEVAGAGAAEAKAVQAKTGDDQQRPGRSQQGEEVSGAGQCDGDREEASATRPKGQQGLIKTLAQAGLGYRGEVHAPCASEGGANPGRIAEGFGGNGGLVRPLPRPVTTIHIALGKARNGLTGSQPNRILEQLRSDLTSSSKRGRRIVG